MSRLETTQSPTGRASPERLAAIKFKHACGAIVSRAEIQALLRHIEVTEKELKELQNQYTHARKPGDVAKRKAPLVVRQSTSAGRGSHHGDRDEKVQLRNEE